MPAMDPAAQLNPKSYPSAVYPSSSHPSDNLPAATHRPPCAAQLDAGVSEKILLLSRDEAAMLVASYGDIKRCVESSYAELRSLASSAVARNRAAGQGGGGGGSGL